MEYAIFIVPLLLVAIVAVMVIIDRPEPKEHYDDWHEYLAAKDANRKSDDRLDI